MGAEKLRGPQLAIAMCGHFKSRKLHVLRAVAEERGTPNDALVSLEKLYERQTREYLRAPGTTYEHWLEHGPRRELEEVREARRIDSVWDRLVDKAVDR